MDNTTTQLETTEIPIIRINNMGALPFPHSISSSDSDMPQRVVCHPDRVFETGGAFYLTSMSPNPKIVTDVKNIRKAKGDWSDYGIVPVVCDIYFS